MKKNENNATSTENLSFSEKVERGDVFSDDCPTRDILKHVTNRWGGLVLLAFIHKPKYRFSELRRLIKGISEKMLAQTLQVLEQDGFILRNAHPVVPPHVDYSLTEKGAEIAQHILALTTWIEENINDIMANRDTQNK